MSKLLRLGLALLCVLGVACGPAAVPLPPPAPAVTVAVSPPQAEPPPESDGPDDGDPGPVPVTDADPSWGRRGAPVTIVAFADFQCPFCARAEATLEKLRRVYGPDRLRIVWKNEPLPFHAKARPAAVVALALFKRSGDQAFWQAHDAMFGDQAHLEEITADAPARAGTTLEELRASPAWGWAEAKIDADHALGKAIGVTGTPAFFINGVFLSGAQPYEKLAAIVDEQLDKAKALVAQGTPPRRVYAELARAQKQAAPPPQETTAPKKQEDDRVVYKVPVGKSPVRGKPTALVTIVTFADFQCPFCGRVAPTLQQIGREYRDKVRFVFKHNPLPFHPRAAPAAELALEARAEKGDAGFWAAHDLLFKQECSGAKGATQQDCTTAGGTWVENRAHLEDADLLGYATHLGLDAARARAAITGKKYAAVIAEDEDLAGDLQATGTPHFFINGRRLLGAQPIEKFRAMIDEEIARLGPMVAEGLPAAKVYEIIQTGAKGAFEPERKTVPAPTAQNPSRGPAGARVVVQMFADFQCPFCQRVLPTIAELEQLFPGKIRVVWRNEPLPMHQHAALAAEAAMEAFSQKGSAGFWAMHTRIFENMSSPGGLERPALEGYAAQIGLDPARFAAALDTHAHRAQVDADKAIADAAGISGTPAFVINGYFVSGAQPLSRFRRIVERALAEAK